MIPRPSALAVLVAGNKTLKHPRDKAPAAPRIENRECSLDETKGKNKTDLPTNPKWQIGLFLWQKVARVQAQRSTKEGEGSAPRESRTVGSGAPLVTFPATGKSPGAWGGAPKRWEQEPAASCNFRVQGGVPAKGHAGTFVPAKDLAPDQNRLGDIRRGFGVPGVKICPDLFGVLLGQHRAAHHHLAGEVLSSQRGDGLLHAL